MINSNRSIQVYCTRPSCQNPINFINVTEEFISSGSQRFCSCCGMPLILDRHFLPSGLLVPDEQQGGFGRTFLAEDTNTNFSNRLRAIKQLHPRTPQDPLNLQRIEELFRLEADVLADLSHPQIPRAWAFFSIEPDSESGNQSTQTIVPRQKFFYLVQSYIEGENLFQELRRRGPFPENEVIDILQDILNILNYIHHYDTNQGLIHRDIKPSNIMRRRRDGRLFLIDFGIVKHIVVEGLGLPIINQSSVLGTPGFAPPEQMRREQVSPSSDFYSLAATCVCLLTRINPTEKLLYNSNWQQHVNVNNKCFANVLDWMLQSEQRNRPQSAQEILDALHPEPPPPPPPPPHNTFKSITRIWRQFYQRIILLFLLGLAAALAIKFYLYPQIIHVIHGLNYDFNTANNFSWGEQILITKKKETLKQAGVIAFKEGRYDDAINSFETYLKFIRDNKTSYRSDPEALIYLNNAYAAKTNNPIRIAVSIPISDELPEIDEQMLFGIAHVQTEVNCGINNNYLSQLDKNFSFNCREEQGINGRFLQVVIANDEQKEDKTRTVATAFVNNPKILGVIGHYGSEETDKVASLYNKKLVAISPTSTVVRQDNGTPKHGLPFSPYIFRTAYTDATAAENLSNYMRKNRKQNALIIKKPYNPFSESISEEFRRLIGTDNVIECSLYKQNYRDVDNCIRNNKNKADVVLMALRRKDLASPESLRTIETIIGDTQLVVLGADTMYSFNLTELAESADIFNKLRDQERLFMAVPWHRSHQNNYFEKSSNVLWRGEVNWRTAMTYDATKIMVEALNKNGNNPTRQGLYSTLLRNDFSIQGATGVVKFKKNGDRNEENAPRILVVVKTSNTDPKKLGFFPYP